MYVRIALSYSTELNWQGSTNLFLFIIRTSFIHFIQTKKATKESLRADFELFLGTIKCRYELRNLQGNSGVNHRGGEEDIRHSISLLSKGDRMREAF